MNVITYLFRKHDFSSRPGGYDQFFPGDIMNFHPEKMSIRELCAAWEWIEYMLSWLAASGNYDVEGAWIVYWQGAFTYRHDFMDYLFDRQDKIYTELAKKIGDEGFTQYLLRCRRDMDGKDHYNGGRTTVNYSAMDKDTLEYVCMLLLYLTNLEGNDWPVGFQYIPDLPEGFGDYLYYQVVYEFDAAKTELFNRVKNQ